MEYLASIAAQWAQWCGCATTTICRTASWHVSFWVHRRPPYSALRHPRPTDRGHLPQIPITTVPAITGASLFCVCFKLFRPIRNMIASSGDVRDSLKWTREGRSLIPTVRYGINQFMSERPEMQRGGKMRLGELSSGGTMGGRTKGAALSRWAPTSEASGLATGASSQLGIEFSRRYWGLLIMAIRRWPFPELRHGTRTVMLNEPLGWERHKPRLRKGDSTSCPASCLSTDWLR